MAALTHFKLAETVLGASPGVAPRGGDEVSHGTDKIPYAPLTASNPRLQQPHDEQADTHAKGTTDFLWNISDYDHWAPGMSGGQYGQEVIG